MFKLHHVAKHQVPNGRADLKAGRPLPILGKPTLPVSPSWTQVWGTLHTADGCCLILVMTLNTLEPVGWL